MATIDPQLFSLFKFPKNESEVYLTGDVPWLFKDLNFYKTYWLNKKNEFLNFHKVSQINLELELKKGTGLSATTRTRLEVLKNAHESNYLALASLLSDLDVAAAPTFEVAVPSHQTLHLYRKNIFRDWGWSTGENQQAVDLVTEVVGPNWKPNRTCVLGTGASRLAMDLHKEFHLPMTVGVDFNPLLLLVANEMQKGHSIKLWDFNTAPVELESVAREYELKSTLGKLSGFHLICADVTELPFRDHQFSSVVTPWLIDILPFGFKLLAQRVNQLLEVGGTWVNFGPLGFSHRDEAMNLTRPEIAEQWQMCGFEVESEKVSVIRYLSSDHEVNSRNETVYLFKIKKVKNVAVEPFEYLPNWLSNTDKPITLSDELQRHKQLVRFQADLFHSIDGKISLQQIAGLFAQHYKMPAETALVMATNVLRQFEESLKRK
tara:strand:- start:1597 stop:2895 length:1299 start_codon:yes stop_codon:yes gene_type:complete